MLIWTVSHEVKAPNVGSLSLKHSGTELGSCTDTACFQYSSLKGYSGWSRHLWRGQMEQVSLLGEVGYHIPAVLCLENIFIAMYGRSLWKVLFLIQKLPSFKNLPCRVGSKPVHSERRQRRTIHSFRLHILKTKRKNWQKLGCQLFCYLAQWI